MPSYVQLQTKGLSYAIELLASGAGPWNTARLRMAEANEALKDVIRSLGTNVTGLDTAVLGKSNNTNSIGSNVSVDFEVLPSVLIMFIVSSSLLCHPVLVAM